MKGESKTCQNCKNQFIIELEDFVFYEKIKVPAPTWCPECRMIRRMIFRNERNLYRRKDDATGKEIFSGFPAQAPIEIYEHDYWWSDKWDPTDHGRDYDFSRSFFGQFLDLIREVPRASRNILNLVNSDYSNNVGYVKNCYLCFNLDGSEDSAYLVDAHSNKNCLDITTSFKGELNYESIAIDGCFQTFFSYGCDECRNVWFSRNCRGCSDCFGCVNLRAKQYHIFNQPYSKEDYFGELNKLDLGSYVVLAAMRERIRNVWTAAPYKFMLGWQNVNVSGDWIAHSKNVKHSFNVVETEDSKFCQNLLLGVKDSYDFTVWGNKSERIYEASETGYGCRNIKFCVNCWQADSDIEYSIDCHSSSNLFGCIGLRKKSYCIFNKQYSKDEYAALRDKIIHHMNEMPYRDMKGRTYKYGEFFPPEFSPFAYNETSAQDYMPLTKEAAVQEGYQWRDQELREYQTTIEAANLPDHIRDVQDSILKEIIKCVSCGKAYRVIQMELEFLRKMQLPLPRLCPNCRYLERIKYRNPPRFYRRRCTCVGSTSDNGVYRNTTNHPPHSADQHCPNEFETSFAPDRKEIVYCEACYNTEVV